MDGATEFNGASDLEQQDTPGERGRLYQGLSLLQDRDNV